MEGRFDWGRYDFGTFRRRDVLTMGRFDCKAFQLRKGRLPINAAGIQIRNLATFLLLTRHE